jgi:hypothetical protein
MDSEPAEAKKRVKAAIAVMAFILATAVSIVCVKTPGATEHKYIGQSRVFMRTDIRDGIMGVHFVILDDGRDGVNQYEVQMYLGLKWQTMNRLLRNNPPVTEGTPVFFPSFEAWKELIDIGELRVRLKPWGERFQKIEPKGREKEPLRTASTDKKFKTGNDKKSIIKPIA